MSFMSLIIVFNASVIMIYRPLFLKIVLCPYLNQVISIRVFLKFVAVLILKLAFSKYKMSNFAIFLNDILPFVFEIMLLLFLYMFILHIYFYSFT